MLEAGNLYSSSKPKLRGSVMGGSKYKSSFEVLGEALGTAIEDAGTIR